MTPIEKFLRNNYTPIVTETKLGLSCILKNKEGSIEDSVVYFERPKKGWSKKPIISNEQFLITDADTTELINFLSQYFSLTEENYMDVKKIIINMSTEAIRSHYGGHE